MYDPGDLAKSFHQIEYISMLRLGCYPSATLIESAVSSLFSKVYYYSKLDVFAGDKDRHTHSDRCSASKGKRVGGAICEFLFNSTIVT